MLTIAVSWLEIPEEQNLLEASSFHEKAFRKFPL